MTTMGFGGRAQMPRVSYATALDFFVIICFSFVFAVMIEYAAINFLAKMTNDMKKLLQERGVKKKVKGRMTAGLHLFLSVSLFFLASYFLYFPSLLISFLHVSHFLPFIV